MRVDKKRSHLKNFMKVVIPLILLVVFFEAVKDGLLRSAAYKGNDGMVRFLLRTGADVDGAGLDWTGLESLSTPVMLAAQGGNGEIVGILIESGADVDARDVNGNTALIYATFFGHYHCARKLVDGGADLDARDDTGKTALMLASMMGRVEFVELYVESGADVSLESSEGKTAYDMAHYPAYEAPSCAFSGDRAPYRKICRLLSGRER